MRPCACCDWQPATTAGYCPDCLVHLGDEDIGLGLFARVGEALEAEHDEEMWARDEGYIGGY